ncbi:MAG: glycoside hydrolase family 1 protein [Clostridia bacterium]|nr:glycoside hydrolase family 1 protein [Clostridia bacterium]
MFDIFSLPEAKMPKDFLWGSGYAGHQVEGNNINSDRWFMEENYEEKSGMACNSYELWERDVEIAEECGLQAFRTSVEWARIEPTDGDFCPEALDHYVRLFASLKERGIKVFATMVHVSIPRWFYKKGGFNNLENMPYFERYLEYAVPKLAPYVDFWNVQNEFNLRAPEAKLGALHFHALGYHIIKKYSDKPVSSAHALVHYVPKRPHDPFDRAMADYMDACDHEFFFHAIRTGEVVFPKFDVKYCPEIKGTADFWSINTYARRMIDARKASGKGDRYDFCRMKMIDMDFYLEEFNPECILSNLGRLHDKPIYITENGLSCNDDRFRIVFIAEYLSAIREAINQGADVRGYLYWSMIDNYEWMSFKPRFGLYDVDFETFERKAKPSAAFFREVIENNGVSPEIIKKHLKEIPSLVK